MSYLSTALQRQAERHRLNQSDIARGAGLSRSHMSRVFSGGAGELTDANFRAILKNFAADPLAQAEIIAARCQDARQAAASLPGADLVEIRIHADPAADARLELPQVHLSQEAERAFAWLRSQCPLNPELEKHLIGYARLTGMI